MTDECCQVLEAGAEMCELPAPGLGRREPPRRRCPVCGEWGKPVHGQTVKALVSVSLRLVLAGDFYFCRTSHCAVAYFSADGRSTFTSSQVRERIFQKEPEASDVLVCYCFRYTVGQAQAATVEERAAVLADVEAGIAAGQCACDLRNPQGSCCLGNVRQLSAGRGRVRSPGAG